MGYLWDNYGKTMGIYSLNNGDVTDEHRGCPTQNQSKINGYVKVSEIKKTSAGRKTGKIQIR
jgi:hypothetical protein